MPTVSVSIRNEDYDKWRALKSPAEFVHIALQYIPMMDETEKLKEFDKHPELKPELSGLDMIVNDAKLIKTPKTGIVVGDKVVKEIKVNGKKYGAVIFDESKFISKSFSARKKK